MDILQYQLHLITQMGFTKWISTYPINPLTILLFFIVLGIFTIRYVHKKRNTVKENKPPKTATLVLEKANIFNTNFAATIKVKEINKNKAQYFLFKSKPAIYIPEGSNTLTVYALWTKNMRRARLDKTLPSTLNIEVEAEKIYTLYYDLRSEKYLLVEGHQLENEQWENSLTNANIIN